MWGFGLAESDAVTFLLYSQFHGSQRTKQPEIFEISRADSNTFPLLYITVGKVKYEYLSTTLPLFEISLKRTVFLIFENLIMILVSFLCQHNLVTLLHLYF